MTIDFKWLGGRIGRAVDRAFYADIGLAVSEDRLTLLEDHEARTVTSHLRGCAYRLATWFAANWSRLRWEPRAHLDLRWRNLHPGVGLTLGCAGALLQRRLRGSGGSLCRLRL